MNTNVHAKTLGLAAAALLAWCPLVSAAPGDNDVEAFAATGLNGPSKLFTLPAGKSEIVYGQPSEDLKWIKSIKTGKRVGVLLQADSKNEYMSATNFSLDVKVDTRFIVLFEKGQQVGVYEGLPIWEHRDPDGAVLAKYSSGTVVGGMSPEWPRLFVPPDFKDASYGDAGLINRIKNADLHWLEVYGKSTEIVLHDTSGGQTSYTSGGKDMAEYDLSGAAYDNLASLEVRVHNISIVPSTGVPRARWAYQDAQHVIEFRKFANSQWVESHNGQAAFNFEQKADSPDYVELYDKSRDASVRLYNDRMTVKDPQRGPDFVQYYGQGSWQDSRYYWTYKDGHFKNASGATWEEYQAGKKAFTFAESSRTAEFVELFDQGRQVGVRLHDDHSLIKLAGGAWGNLYPGKWDLEDLSAINLNELVPILPLKPILPKPPQPSPGPQPPPPGQKLPDLAGTWNSSIGVEYQMAQKGADFTWFCAARMETAAGKLLSAQDVTVQWYPVFGQPGGAAKGKITQVDAKGKATSIQWDNGVVFTRK